MQKKTEDGNCYEIFRERISKNLNNYNFITYILRYTRVENEGNEDAGRRRSQRRCCGL